jgi:hypothetical protein
MHLGNTATSYRKSKKYRMNYSVEERCGVLREENVDNAFRSGKDGYHSLVVLPPLAIVQAINQSASRESEGRSPHHSPAVLFAASRNRDSNVESCRLEMRLRCSHRPSSMVHILPVYGDVINCTVYPKSHPFPGPELRAENASMLGYMVPCK